MVHHFGLPEWLLPVRSVRVAFRLVSSAQGTQLSTREQRQPRLPLRPGRVAGTQSRNTSPVRRRHGGPPWLTGCTGSGRLASRLGSVGSPRPSSPPGVVEAVITRELSPHRTFVPAAAAIGSTLLHRLQPTTHQPPSGRGILPANRGASPPRADLRFFDPIPTIIIRSRWTEW